MFENGDGGIGSQNPDFGAGLKFDSDSMLEVCMGGANYQIECKIKGLTLLYTFRSMGFLISDAW